METVETRQPAPQVVETAAPAPGSGTAFVDLRRTAEPGRFVEALAGMNDESRARVTNALQRSAGNVAVTRMLAHDSPRRSASAAVTQLQRQPELVPIVVGGTNLGIGAYLAAGGTVAGGTALAEGTAVVAGTVLAEGAAVVGTSAVAGGATVVAVPAAAAATATGGVATAGAVAGGSATVPVVGWIVAGVIVGGIVIYLVYRATRDEGRPPVQAPSASPGAPVTEPSSGPPVSLPPATGSSSAPMVDPGPSAPASLPGAPHDGPVLASGDPDDRRGNVERLEDLERGGDYTGSDPVNLRERLMSDRPEVRQQAEQELRSLEAAAQAMRQPASSSEPAPITRPFTRDAAFDALMERYPRPLNTEPYNRHPRSHYEPIGWEQEQSSIPGELRHVLVIRGTQGNVANRQLRFSVSWNEARGQFEDVHEASGRP